MKPKLLFPVSATLLVLAIGIVFVAINAKGSSGNVTSNDGLAQQNENNEASPTDYIFFNSVSKNFFVPLIK